ncbi:hypothetical protein FKW77_000145 [Venturia effusa]|uniref:DUF7730 domain-containing protein n=1 Tax=Venturia effusa TaxID=50376 RepID=A0A517LBR9_9PEZI|nr:hypothetical protein FKW77_000145 [Venturia effusa]
MEARALVPHRSTLQNTQNSLSPLLRLPAEIRNQIYDLVLGNNSLHVYACKTTGGKGTAKANYYTCTVPHSDQNHESGLQHPEWLKQHLPCFTPGSARLPDLGLMFTCRQIYAETRLLPYSANEFMFVTPNSLQTYVESVLSHEQSKALKTLNIWSAVVPDAAGANTSDFTGTATWTCWDPPIAISDGGLLEGIQEVRFNISVFAGDANRGARRDLRGIQGLTEFLKLTRLKRLSVAVGQDEESGILDERGETQAYAAEIKAKIFGIFAAKEAPAEQQ